MFTPAKFKIYLKEIKVKYPDARHHCSAYLCGKPGQTTLLGCSDDGEPSGTAGKPMLGVLQHKGIGDIAIIVVRYFGGIKLGTGGQVQFEVKLPEDDLSLLSNEFKNFSNDRVSFIEK